MRVLFWITAFRGWTWAILTTAEAILGRGITWNELIPDHMAFALMDAVAAISCRVWREQRLRRIPVYEYIPPEEDARSAIAAERGLIRLREAVWYFMGPDGWRPARYV